MIQPTPVLMITHQLPRSKILYQQQGIVLDQMLDTETIVQRFLDTKLQVHPEVVRYLAEKGDNDLLERVVSSVPDDTIVVLAQHVPGMGLSRRDPVPDRPRS